MWWWQPITPPDPVPLVVKDGTLRVKDGTLRVMTAEGPVQIYP